MSNIVSYHFGNYLQIPFREAHGLSGMCVALAEKKQCPLSSLSLEDFKSIRYDKHQNDPGSEEFWIQWSWIRFHLNIIFLAINYFLINLKSSLTALELNVFWIFSCNSIQNSFVKKFQNGRDRLALFKGHELQLITKSLAIYFAVKSSLTTFYPSGIMRCQWISTMCMEGQERRVLQHR